MLKDPKIRASLIRVCAIFIYKSGEDETKLRFWSQILGCERMMLFSLMKMTKSLDGKLGGIIPNDRILMDLWPTMQQLNYKECKTVFDSLRKEEP